MKHLIKISSALVPAAFVTLGFTVPIFFWYLLLNGHYIALLALIIFIPSFISFLSGEYR